MYIYNAYICIYINIYINIYIYIYNMKFAIEGFLEVAIESWPGWNLRIRTTEFRPDALTNWTIRP